MKDFAESTIRVRYAETDQMGIVYHSNYLIWFEVGRVDLCRHLGFEYKQMESDENTLLVVAEAYCRFKRPSRFDDVLTVRTWVAQSMRRTVRFEYEVVDQQSGEVIATGFTNHVVCDSLGRARSLPEKYRKYFPSNNQRTTEAART
jgi:acyl-CoA thioester hydrolase